MTPSFRLVATDLDGTLLRDDHVVTERTRGALAAAVSAGAVHVAVTGRSVPWATAVLDEIGYRGLAVCAQGAQLYDTGERRLLTSVTLDRQVARLAVEKLTAELGPVRLAAGQAGLDGAVLVEPGYHYEQRLPVIRVADRDALWAEPLLKLFVQHPGHDDDELTALAASTLHGLVDVTCSGPGIVELVPVGLSKAIGLSLAARRLGLGRADAVAFGDMPNDVPMLRWVAHGVAMGNAHPQVRAVADEVTSSNNEDGVARVLERLFGPCAPVRSTRG